MCFYYSWMSIFFLLNFDCRAIITFAFMTDLNNDFKEKGQNLLLVAGLPKIMGNREIGK